MTGKLKTPCEIALTTEFEAQGLTRFKPGLYARTDREGVSRGLWIAFNGRSGQLIVQPCLGVFFPPAERLVSNGLVQLYDTYRRPPYWGKLGSPILTKLLYDLVRVQTGRDRTPMSYDVFSPQQAANKAKLIAEDFREVSDQFFATVSSVGELRDRLMVEGFPASRMYAMAIAYLIQDGITAADLIQDGITAAEIDKIRGPSPNPMTREFAKYFKKNFAEGKAKH